MYRFDMLSRCFSFSTAYLTPDSSRHFLSDLQTAAARSYLIAKRAKSLETEFTNLRQKSS